MTDNFNYNKNNFQNGRQFISIQNVTSVATGNPQRNSGCHGQLTQDPLSALRNPSQISLSSPGDPTEYPPHYHGNKVSTHYWLCRRFHSYQPSNFNSICKNQSTSSDNETYLLIIEIQNCHIFTNCASSTKKLLFSQLPVLLLQEERGSPDAPSPVK